MGDLQISGKSSMPEGAEGIPPDANRSASSPENRQREGHLNRFTLQCDSPSACFSCARKSAIGSSVMVNRQFPCRYW